MDFIYQEMKRDGYCRCCDSLLKRDEDLAVKLYSIRNRGQNIIICSDCVCEMYYKVSTNEVDY